MISHWLRPTIKSGLDYPLMWRWAAQLLLISLTCILFFPALNWMFDTLLGSEHRFQLICILMLFGVLVYKLKTNEESSLWLKKQQFSYAPIVLFVVSICGFLINERFVDIHILSAVLCIFAFYGLIGFYCSNRTWQKGWLPTFLLVILLPFGDYLDVYLGFPLRLLTAYVSSDILSALTFSSVSSDTVIVIENQFAQVDLSCSGVKGIWSGLAFFVLLTWIEDKQVQVSWFWRLGVFLAALIAANIIRVTCLVLLGSGLSNLEFANLIHETLGIICFALACLIGWGLLLTYKQRPNSSPQNDLSKKANNYSQLPNSTLPILLLTVIVSILAYSPIPKVNTNLISTDLVLPDNWLTVPMSLSFQEQQFFNRNQAKANKFNFQLDGQIEGSLIAVHSTYWKGQHDPKNCHISQGYRIVDDTALRLSDTGSVRFMKLTREDKSYVAIYWFQNYSLITDDYSKRLFSSIMQRDEPWVLASILLENPNQQVLDIRMLVYPIKNAIEKELTQANNHEL